MLLFHHFFFLALLLKNGSAAKILILWISWPSHRYFFQRAANILCQEGHSVWSLHAEDAVHPLAPGAVDVACNNGHQHTVYVQYDQATDFAYRIYDYIWTSPLKTLVLGLPEVPRFYRQFCVQALQSGVLDKLKKENFDLLLIDQYHSECSLWIQDYLMVQAIRVTQGMWMYDDMDPVGAFTPYSYVFHPYNQDAYYPVSMVKRATNLLVHLFLRSLRRDHNMVKVNRQTAFNPRFPSENVTKQQTLMVHGHMFAEDIIPQRPTFVCLQLFSLYEDSYSAKTKLAPKLASFLNQKPFIVISFGSGAITRYFPSLVVDSVKRTISYIQNFNIIMQWSGNNLRGFNAKNLMMLTSLPLRDILQHRNCRLYVTSGGKAGILEAMLFGVPIFALPSYLEHFRNGDLVQNLGLGLADSLRPLTVDALQQGVTQVAWNKKYSAQAKKFASMLTTLPQRSRETFMWTITHRLKATGRIARLMLVAVWSVCVGHSFEPILQTYNMADLLQGVKVIRNDKSNYPEVDAAEQLNGKVVALYFSAHWCPPCRQFTPELAKFYDMVDNIEFEIVFVSWDNKEEDFKLYLEECHGSWCALKFGDPRIEALTKRYNVTEIPLLLIVKPNGEILRDNARMEVQEGNRSDPIAVFRIWQSGEKKITRRRKCFCCCCPIK